MVHEHHQWLADVNDWIVETYRREQEKSRQPSNIQEIGHSNESLWDEVLTEWLPAQYEVRKNKYLLLETSDGPVMTKEHDLVVFHPHYPMALRKKHKVLAAGVAAVFSVKRTVKRAHVLEAYEDAALLRRGMKIRDTTPRECLAPPVFFGLLGESSQWSQADDGKEKIKKLVDEHDQQVKKPREGLDMLCIADLGHWVRSTSIVRAETWRNMQMPLSLATNMPQQLIDLFTGGDAVFSGLRHRYDDPQPLYPLTHLIGTLWWKLAINDPAVQPLADGFRFTDTYPSGGELAFKSWKLSDLTTQHTVNSVGRGFIPNSDWQYLF